MIVADHRRHQPYTTERPFFTTGFRKNLSVFSYCVELSLSGNSEYRQDQNTDFYQLTQQALAVFQRVPVCMKRRFRRAARDGVSVKGVWGCCPIKRKRVNGCPGRTVVFAFLTASGIACHACENLGRILKNHGSGAPHALLAANCDLAYRRIVILKIFVKNREHRVKNRCKVSVVG